MKTALSLLWVRGEKMKIQLDGLRKFLSLWKKALKEAANEKFLCLRESNLKIYK